MKDVISRRYLKQKKWSPALKKQNAIFPRELRDRKLQWPLGAESGG